MEKNLAEHGLRVISDGHLSWLRKQLGLSITMQSHMMGVQPAALRSWEEGLSMPSKASRTKVATWYEQVMDRLAQADVVYADLVHISLASQYLARSYVTIRAMCSTGALQCVDLGPLGLYVAREELGEVNFPDHARRVQEQGV